MYSEVCKVGKEKHMYTNAICPITLEAIAEMHPDDIFVHRETAMNLEAFYVYLINSVYFVNPVTRVPLTLEDLVELEQRIKAKHGIGAIDYSPPQASTEGVVVLPHEIGMQRDVSIHVERHGPVDVRLTVNVDVPTPSVHDQQFPDVPPEPPPLPPEVIPSDDDVFRPPVPSVVGMFLDGGRERRLRDRLSMIQYLQYEGAEIVAQMRAVLDDTQWHQQVWNQTSSSVLEAVMDFMREQTDGDETAWEARLTSLEAGDGGAVEPADLSLEVQYDECWEIYRMLVLHTLETRYTLAARDLYLIDRREFATVMDSHLATLREQCDTTGPPYSLLVTILQSSRSLIEEQQND
jgi:hypothetical protein